MLSFKKCLAVPGSPTLPSPSTFSPIAKLKLGKKASAIFQHCMWGGGKGYRWAGEVVFTGDYWFGCDVKAP